MRSISESRKRQLYRPHELETLTLRMVRPLVKLGQEAVRLQLDNPPRVSEIGLLWLERYGGTFGSRSSAEAASRRFLGISERFLTEKDPEPEERYGDRGRVPAWIAYLSCPSCGKRCTVLRTPIGTNAWACWKCLPQLAPRNQQPGSPASRKHAHRHRYWAMRIRCEYMGLPADVAGDLVFQPAICLQRPKGCRFTHERWEALRRLAAAHETLWQLAELDSTALILRQLPGLKGVLRSTTDDRIMQLDATRWAKAVIRLDRWALRQMSWHRRGRPRNPNEARARHNVTCSVGMEVC